MESGWPLLLGRLGNAFAAGYREAAPEGTGGRLLLRDGWAGGQAYFLAEKGSEVQEKHHVSSLLSSWNGVAFSSSCESTAPTADEELTHTLC